MRHIKATMMGINLEAKIFDCRVYIDLNPMFVPMFKKMLEAKGQKLEQEGKWIKFDVVDSTHEKVGNELVDNFKKAGFVITYDESN